MLKSTSATEIGAFVLLLAVLACCTILVTTDDVSGNAFMAVVVGPLVGGLIGFVAGTKGVQQGTEVRNGNP